MGMVGMPYTPEELYVSLIGNSSSTLPPNRSLIMKHQFPLIKTSLPLQVLLVPRTDYRDLILLNIDKAPLCRSTIILEKETNCGKEEDVTNKSLRTNQESPIMAREA